MADPQADDTSPGQDLFLIAAGCALSLPLTAFRAFVVADLWPVFAGPLPAIGFWQAWGIIYLLILLGVASGEKTPPATFDERTRRMGRAVVGNTFGTLIIWGIGLMIAAFARAAVGA